MKFITKAIVLSPLLAEKTGTICETVPGKYSIEFTCLQKNRLPLPVIVTSPGR